MTGNPYPPLSSELRATLDTLSPGWDTPPKQAVFSSPGAIGESDNANAVARAIAYLDTLPPSIQGQRGSDALMWAARCVAWGFALTESDAIAILRAHYNPRCVPEWSENEIKHKVASALDGNFSKPRGWLLAESRERDFTNSSTNRADSVPHAEISPDVLAALAGASPPRASPVLPPEVPEPVGQCDRFEVVNAIVEPIAPASDLANPTFPAGTADDDPFRLARLFLARYAHAHGYRLRYWLEDFAQWVDGGYSLITATEIKGTLTTFVEDEFARIHAPRMRAYEIAREKGSDEKPPAKQRVTRNLIADVLNAVCAITRTDAKNAPAWVGVDPPTLANFPNPLDVISVRNGLIHIPTISRNPNVTPATATPRFFTFNQLDFDYDGDTPQPQQWLQFLSEIWPDDPDSIACLQEWFGYLLTPDTSLHKILMLIGPPRAGKGTIGRILKAIIGEVNVVSPKLGSLADRFGLQPLIGKLVAIIGDARLSGRQDAVAVTEQLLGISGEDPQTIDRKNRDAITLQLRTRFVLLSNEVPRLGDASGAILSRLVILKLTRSFLGKEDLKLSDKIIESEMPGVMKWAIEGLVRLKANGRFTRPESSEQVYELAEGMISPVKAFVVDRCSLEADAFTSTQELYDAWSQWCEKRGRHPGTDATFVRDLVAAYPDVCPIRKKNSGDRIRGYNGIRLLVGYEADGIPL